MSRTLKILSAIAVLLVALVVAGVAVLKSIDFNEYRGLIAEQVKGATGRDLTIAGELTLDISLSPAVVVEGVTFANAAWGSRPEMAKLKRLEAEVELLPLISGDVRVTRLVLIGLDLLAETDAKGTGNWVMAAAGPKEPAKAEPSDGGKAGPLPVVRKVHAEDVKVTYRDGRSGETKIVVIEKLDASADGLNDPLKLDLKGSYNAAPFSLAGQVGSVSQMLEGGSKFPVDLEARAMAAAVSVKGDIAQPREAKGLNLLIAAKGDDLAATVAAVQKLVPAIKDVAVPPVGPYAVAARVKGSPESLSVSDIKVSIGRADQVLLGVTGSVADPLNARGLALSVNVEGKDIQAFSGLAGGPLPKLPPFKIAAAVADIDKGYVIDGLKATVGKSDLAGRLVAAVADKPLGIEAQLTSNLLDLGEMLPEEPKAKETPKPAPAKGEKKGEKRVFSDDPLPLEGLKAANADISVKAGRIVLPNGLPLENTDIKIVLNKGRLTVQPLATQIAGGRIDGTVNLDGSSGKALLDSKIAGKGIDLGSLLKAMKIDDSTEGGKTDLDINLVGSGGSVRQLMAGLNGKIQVTVGEGKIKNTALNWIGGDVVTQTFDKINPLAKKEEFTYLQCAVVRFLIKDGIATADKGVAIETRKMNIVGSGAVNLKTEGLDFAVQPQAKEGAGINLTGSMASMMRVSGTLAEPGVGLDALGTAKTVGKVGTAIATGGLSLLADSLLEKAQADETPCLTALGKAPQKKAGAAGGSAGPVEGVAKGVGGAVKGVTEGVGDTVKGIGGALGDFFGGKKK